MKKNVLKKLMCAVLAAACVATAVVPAMADDVITVEAATKKVTSAYRYHIDGYDKKGSPASYSKASFYKDLNSLPAVKMGKYVFTLDNLQGTDDKSLKCLSEGIYKPVKEGKKYKLEYLYPDAVGNYGDLYENNYLARLRTILDNYKAEHPEYADVIEETYEYQKDFVNKYPVAKDKFTTKLKKGHTYVFIIDNSLGKTTCKPYFTTHGSDEQSCLYNTNYLKAYSFDMNIEYRK